jgi:7-keto-8-aminopelargonate synthetase-like enzyme
VLLGERLDAGGDVHGVSDGCVLASCLRADVTQHRAPGVNSDADLQPFLAARGARLIEHLEAHQHRFAALDRFERVRGVAQRRAEPGHQAVADELVQRAAVGEVERGCFTQSRAR